MATLPLVPVQIETVFQAVTLAMGLNLSSLPAYNPNNIAANPQFGCRIPWQQQGQPFQGINDDVAYVRCIEVDDLYNRVRDVSYQQTPETFTKVTNYTRVWETYWTVYGPNSFDNCRKIRTRLFDQDIYNQFAASQLYLVTDPTAPRRVPEEHDGQWWERCDFSARFNEFVTETYATESLLTSEIIVDNQFGTELFDITVEE